MKSKKRVLETRVEKSVTNYNGVNLYDSEGNYMGDIIWTDTKSGKTKVRISVDGIRFIPKAIDDRDDSYRYDDDDIIE
jgi:hypothetical protein